MEALENAVIQVFILYEPGLAPGGKVDYFIPFLFLLHCIAEQNMPNTLLFLFILRTIIREVYHPLIKVLKEIERLSQSTYFLVTCE